MKWGGRGGSGEATHNVRRKKQEMDRTSTDRSIDKRADFCLWLRRIDRLICNAWIDSPVGYARSPTSDNGNGRPMHFSAAQFHLDTPHTKDLSEFFTDRSLIR